MSTFMWAVERCWQIWLGKSWSAWLSVSKAGGTLLNTQLLGRAPQPYRRGSVKKDHLSQNVVVSTVPIPVRTIRHQEQS
jgi:hypothetical protein